MRKWLELWLPLAGIALLPVLSDYLANRYQVAVQDLVFPIAIQLWTALVISLFFVYAWRRISRAGALTTALLVTFFLSRPEPFFSPINDIIYPLRLRYILLFLPFLCLTLFALANALSYLFAYVFGWLTKRLHWQHNDQVRTLQIIVGIAFLLVFAPSAWDLATAWPQFFYKPPALPALPASAQATSKPDIYYIVLDDYTSQDVLKNQLGYDNSAFMQFLREQDYTTKPDAYSFYPYTTSSIASTLNANYATDLTKRFGNSPEQTIIPFHQSIKNSSVIKQFRDIGYRYDLIGTWYDTTDTSPLADTLYQDNGVLTLFGRKLRLNNFAIDEPVLSIWWGIIARGLTIGNFPIIRYQGQAHDVMTLASLQNLRDLVSQPAGGRFIFAHILIPHNEYFFKPDGSPAVNNAANDNDEPINQKYTDQVQFANSQIEPILQQINTASKGQAIVVLQAEEGPYPIELNHHSFAQQDVDDELDTKSMFELSQTDLKMKYGILAAYHVPQASPAAISEGADPVNIFRLITNVYFGTNTPYLPACYFGYPNGRDRALSFADISQRLTGRDNPVCKNYLKSEAAGVSHTKTSEIG